MSLLKSFNFVFRIQLIKFNAIAKSTGDFYFLVMEQNFITNRGVISQTLPDPLVTD